MCRTRGRHQLLPICSRGASRCGSAQRTRSCRISRTASCGFSAAPRPRASRTWATCRPSAKTTPNGESSFGRRTSMENERPVASPRQNEIWGSDAIAALLRALDIPYIALNPGASFRGLHDSLVNYLGNERPQLLLCLHEESAVAIAHGYAKASGRMMGVALHSNVGLMHATMAIFNAWCDRMPMLILGATG